MHAHKCGFYVIHLLLTLHNIIVGCTHGNIRTPLLGGVADTEGLVEVCVNGTYYTVSLDNGRFSVREATVICKQLQLGNGKKFCYCKSHLSLSMVDYNKINLTKMHY